MTHKQLGYLFEALATASHDKSCRIETSDLFTSLEEMQSYIRSITEAIGPLYRTQIKGTYLIIEAIEE